MEEVATWFSAELVELLNDAAELAEIESKARLLAKDELWSAFHHRGSIPIEYKVVEGTLYIY